MYDHSSPAEEVVMATVDSEGLVCGGRWGGHILGGGRSHPDCLPTARVGTPANVGVRFHKVLNVKMKVLLCHFPGHNAFNHLLRCTT